jgi:hypothetical protein
VEWDDIPGEDRDWYVSYWPGPRAKEEIQCIPRQLALTIEAVRNTEEEPVPPSPSDDDLRDQIVAPVVADAQTKPSRRKRSQDKPELTDTELQLLKQMESLGMSRIVAEDLVRRSDPQVIINWLKVIEDEQNVQDRPAYLVKALREGWQLPESFCRREAERREAESQEEERRKAASCPSCQGMGVYQVDKNTVAICHHTGQKTTLTPNGQKLDTDSIWTQALAKLRDQISAPAFTTWLKDTKLLAIDGHTAIIGVASQFAVDWLERRLFQAILRSLEQVLDQPVQVEFVVNQQVESSKEGG